MKTYIITPAGTFLSLKDCYCMENPEKQSDGLLHMLLRFRQNGIQSCFDIVDLSKTKADELYKEIFFILSEMNS